MPDVDARLDKVEEGLKQLGERVDAGFTRMDQRFAQVDERFAQIDERFVKSDERFESLEKELQKLKVLGEQNTTDIKRIAEVQVHHGNVLERHGAALERIEKAVEPLKAVAAALENVLPDHERRIRTLEAASSTRRPEP